MASIGFLTLKAGKLNLYKVIPGMVFVGWQAMCARAVEAHGERVRFITGGRVLAGPILAYWVFHFSPQKSAPRSQLLFKTGCWSAEVVSD